MLLKAVRTCLAAHLDGFDKEKKKINEGAWMQYWQREMTGTVVKERALTLAFVTNIVGFSFLSCP